MIFKGFTAAMLQGTIGHFYQLRIMEFYVSRATSQGDRTNIIKQCSGHCLPKDHALYAKVLGGGLLDIGVYVTTVFIRK